MRTILLFLTLVYCCYAKAQVHKIGQPCQHYHATSDVNSGTFADARIAASNVTQHQSALTIAESQITNLVSDLAAKAPLASPAFTGTPTGIGLPVYARVTGSDATTTGQSLTNITGLSVALTTNATYEFEANLSVAVSAVTTGNQYGVNYSVAGGTVEAIVDGSLTTTANQTVRLSALNTATVAYVTGSGQSGGILIKGIITTGANAGNLTIQHLKVTSGTSTVRINSFLKVTRIL